MAEIPDRAPVLPGVLGERFRVTDILAGPSGVDRYGVVDADGQSFILDFATRATLFDDPLSAFQGAAVACFGPRTPPTPIAAAARALHRCHNPSIPRAQGVGTVDLRPWIVTARPSGNLVSETALPWHGAEALPLAEALFEALSHAHARGVVHRAPSLENLFWGPGGLGLVGWTQAAVDGVPPPDLEVDPRIVAPEVWLGAEPQPSVDLYAAGVVLYWLLTGAPPFEVVEDCAWHHVHSAPKPLPAGPPPALRDLVHTLLAKNPARRPNGARAALDMLRAASTRARSAHTGTFAEVTPRLAPRRPGRALLALDFDSDPPAPTEPVDVSGDDDDDELADLGSIAGALDELDAAFDDAWSGANHSIPDASLEMTEPAPPPGSPNWAFDGKATYPIPALEEAPPVPEEPLAAARHLLACRRPEAALRRCVDAEGQRRTTVADRVRLRILAGRALLDLGREDKAFEAFDFAVHTDPGPPADALIEVADAALSAGRIGVAVDASLRALVLDLALGTTALARTVGRALLRLGSEPSSGQMLPLAVACTHLAFRAIEEGDDPSPWFQRGREIGQAGLMSLEGRTPPVFPLHLALCGWGVGDTRAAERSLKIALDAGMKVPTRVSTVDAVVCMRLALLATHQRARAKSPPPPLQTWAESWR